MLAQEKTVSGTVVDADGAMPLPGVTVLEKGTSNGVSTDFDGNFSIEVNEEATLVFSMVGYKKQEIVVTGKSNVDVRLGLDTESLDEVVVTALGIKREEKTLTYAQQEIGEDEISKTRESNFVNSLAGKTSGLQLKQSATGAGGSSKIVLRGNKSIFGVSSPLFVIDGVPMVNNAGTSDNSVFNSTDSGDGLSQINPDDIKSISVLKGANAAALYGSQGANGVVIINTKSGEPGKLSGSVSSGVLFDKAIDLPDMQYRYGSVEGSDESWATEKSDYNDDFVEDFFDTGLQLTNSLMLSGGSEKSLSYISYANTISKGIVPENDYMRHNLTFKQTNKYFEDKLKITSRIMLTDEKIGNKPNTGYYFNPLTGLYLFPRDKNFNDYKENYEVFDEGRNMMLQNWFVDSDKQQNPYWVINNNSSENRVKRMIANLAVEYDINEKLKLQVRGNYDYSTNEFDKRIKAGTASTISHRNGRWIYRDLTSNQMYADAILTYSDRFGDFDLSAVLGGSYEKSVIGDGVDVDSDFYGLQYANIFNFQNLNKEVLVKQVMESRKEKQGLFANAQIGYKDMLYLDLSGRNDWSSTLAFTGNSSYFYPAIGATALLSEIVEMPSFIDFAKFRASYSVVSNEVPSFFTRPLNEIDSDGIIINTEKPFSELEPEDQKSFEVGTDWRFFGNRLGLDFTYYRIDNENQFIPLSAPAGSGYSVYYVNAGHIQNTGFEAAIHAKPIRTEDFEWESNVNFSSNKNEIIELHPELQGRYELSKSEGYALYINEGGSFGDIYVYQFERDDQGRILVNDEGVPQRSSEYEFIGNAEPDFMLGWNNSFTYKDFTLSFLIDGKFGGKAVSATEALLDGYGVSERSAAARDRGFVQVNAVDMDGNAVSEIDAETYYKAVGGRDGIMENYTYSATNIRLRQAALAYNFKFDEHVFFDQMNLSLIANNLFFFYKDAPFDPDRTFSGGNNFQSFDLFTVPIKRSFGFNVNLKF